ncbi:pseudouridine synthase [Catenovulum agarivorans DS-2]|uniref:Pseudouridine synthase n=1 Tax=Catenovulum agarivorans DS-2 TaxID=1328313 RepID=W7QGV6_9ALTE|nr:RluA family pseudouridine synthase [Catenovulum agarivorans]EWH12174.1 pseudouridine synthase [Catenovulum agarivorans DS-2]
MEKFIYKPPHGLPTILFQDKDILVINKPSGLLSNPGRAIETHDCALSRLQIKFPTVILVHRLDCETSGIMVFALNKPAESHLKKQFEARTTAKTYLAEVIGHPSQDSGCLDWPLTADKSNIPKQMVAESGKVAVTNFEVLIHKQQSSIVALKPETGRTHQLRVHMHHWGHTILGDNFYAPASIKNMAPRLRLHAYRLGFTHPYSNKYIEFSTPADF